MTATYDGHLVIDGKTKRILPCCEVMAEASYTPICTSGSSARVRHCSSGWPRRRPRGSLPVPSAGLRWR